MHFLIVKDGVIQTRFSSPQGLKAKDGYVETDDDSQYTDKNEILSQIIALEASVTPRRLREAVLGTDNGWLASKDAEIASLRSQL